MSMTTDEQNTWIDWILRGQTAPTLPANWYASLLSAVPDVGLPNGTEITTGGVTRQSITRSLANFSGTQGAGSTSASSGTSGTSSNNIDIEFVDEASAAISGAVAVAFWDASSGGNVRFYGLITADGSPVTRSWASGDPVVVNAGDLQLVIGG
jgi:hypothetical protein